MDDYLVSVIVPVFNAEKYLEKCINSILSQSYKNIEILLINDGSSDNSLEICESFAKRQNNIKVHSDKNIGPSHARNIGIENSLGTFLIFIDADDYIDEKMIEKLVLNANNYNADISMCNVKRIEEDGRAVKDYNKFNDGIITYDSKSFRGNMEDPRGYYTFAVNKLIKKSVIKNVRFNEKIFYNEDGLFYYNLSENINRAVYDSDSYLYYYVSHGNTATKKGFNDKFFTVLDSFESIEKYFDDFNTTNREIFAYKYINYAIRAKYYLWKKKTQNSVLQNKIDGIVKKYYKIASKCELLNKKEKIKFMLKTKQTYIYYRLKDIINKGRI